MKRIAYPVYCKQIVLLIISLCITGCALSPQTININPDIKVQGKTGQSRTIQLEVVDERNSPVLGQRGGVYKDTSSISTSDDMTKTLRNSLVRALEKQGYSVVGQGADHNLTVSVISMSYKAHTEELLNKIEIGIAIRATASRDGKEYTGDYKTNRKKDYVKLPGMEENEKVINETLASLLESMLDDDDLIEFINN